MKKTKDLLGMYMEAKTSLEEEEYLTKNRGDNCDSSEALWFSYLKNQKQSAPPDLEKQITNLISQKHNSRNRVIRLSLSAAAVILIVITLTISGIFSSREMDYYQKVTALEEANEMIQQSAPKSEPEEILYEDKSFKIVLK